jgi:hypothetical protein
VARHLLALIGAIIVIGYARSRRTRRRQVLDPRIGGLRVRCSAYPNLHWRTSVQVTVVCVPPWTVLDLGELQLQLEVGTRRVSLPERPLTVPRATPLLA